MDHEVTRDSDRLESYTINMNKVFFAQTVYLHHLTSSYNGSWFSKDIDKRSPSFGCLVVLLLAKM